jgi:hypothetical protein
MYQVSKLEEAALFLKEIKALIASSGIIFMNGRAKNTQSLANLGISLAIQKEIINDLIATDYCGGPEQDEKYNWKVVAVFGYNYFGT